MAVSLAAGGPKPPPSTISQLNRFAKFPPRALIQLKSAPQASPPMTAKAIRQARTMTVSRRLRAVFMAKFWFGRRTFFKEIDSC